MQTLLDTCVLVDLLREHAAARAAVKAIASRPVVCAVSIMELYAGAQSQSEERQIDRLCGLFHLAKIDLLIFKAAGAHLRHFHASHSLDMADALIAATAEHHGLKLATLNVKHFPMIKGLKRAY
jgi:predicted nucleic acid-binding protein